MQKNSSDPNDTHARMNPMDLVKRVAALIAALMATASAGAKAGERESRFPTIPAGHTHAHALLENAMRYVAPANGAVDAVSGYPFEGWNHDVKNGLFLRSFTQLTAIGLYMELLANVVAGHADTPDLTREKALANLTRLVETLRRDQRDPQLASKGLMVNFLDLATGKRLSPLGAEIEKKTILEAFGADRGEAIWKCLVDKGWIKLYSNGLEASIQRDAKYGYEHFDGALASHADEATRQKLMALLDRRVVQVVFGDNSNLSASAAKSIGALLTPGIADRPEVARLRQELDRFLDAQREGYAQLYDDQVGLFYFGINATTGRLFGWEDAQGKWFTAHMDYFVNEFRAPSIFVAARFGITRDAIKDLGFKVKPYRPPAGDVIYYSLAPWEGSAFQAMGLTLSLGELRSPSWRELLGNVVDIEIDYSTRKGLPGFLSESYTGEGVQYTGRVGIPDITVSPRPRITDAASLYCLGVAYSIAPEKVERFLAANWPVISTLLTDHGPWEGYNIARREPIKFQTSSHTLALALGLIGTGSANMRRYAEQKGFAAGLDEFFKTGEPVDLLSDATKAFAWANKDGRIESSREGGSLRVKGEGIKLLGIAFVPTAKDGINLSGGALNLRYRSTRLMDPVVIALKPVGKVDGLIPKEIFTRLTDTGGKEAVIRVPLPATVGLMQIKEVVISHERTDPIPVDLSITHFDIVPTAPVAAGSPR
jgi:hypothetical protein